MTKAWTISLRGADGNGPALKQDCRSYFAEAMGHAYRVAMSACCPIPQSCPRVPDLRLPRFSDPQYAITCGFWQLCASLRRLQSAGSSAAACARRRLYVSGSIDHNRIRRISGNHLPTELRSGQRGLCPARPQPGQVRHPAWAGLQSASTSCFRLASHPSWWVLRVSGLAP